MVDSLLGLGGVGDGNLDVSLCIDWSGLYQLAGGLGVTGFTSGLSNFLTDNCVDGAADIDLLKALGSNLVAIQVDTCNGIASKQNLKALPTSSPTAGPTGSPSIALTLAKK